MLLANSGASVIDDWIHWLIHGGRLYRVSGLWSSVASATGVDLIIDVPAGVGLNFAATYYSKFGGIVSKSFNPAVTAIGTEIKPINLRTDKPMSLKTKFYHTPTATAGTEFLTYDGIPGGTGVAGTGSSGGHDQRIEFIFKPGRWFINIKPYADSADIVFNAFVYEGKP